MGIDVPTYTPYVLSVLEGASEDIEYEEIFSAMIDVLRVSSSKETGDAAWEDFGRGLLDARLDAEHLRAETVEREARGRREEGVAAVRTAEDNLLQDFEFAVRAMEDFGAMEIKAAGVTIADRCGQIK